jgi:tRNA-dihydrouridine synthase 1
MNPIEIDNVSPPFKFWRQLGSPRKVVAPMVDHSDLPYRMMVRKYGADLVYTQMFNANIFAQSKEYRKTNFATCPEDRPLVVQFAGHDPATLLKAAKKVEHLCDAVDLNLGCPQNIAKRGRYGAFLMEELDLLAEIVSTLSKGLKIPVFCKTRIYKDFDMSIRLYETLVNAGASLLTIHGRTREEKGQWVREADWGMIARIKKHFAGRVPIIANGGIESLDDVHRCIQHTGADGVMSSEAILENPSLYYECLSSPVQLTQLDLTGRSSFIATDYHSLSCCTFSLSMYVFCYDRAANQRNI